MSAPTTALRTSESTYIKTEEDFSVNATATAIGPWETWAIEVIEGDPDRVALKSNFGRYLKTEEDYSVNAGAEAVGPWETWTVEHLEEAADRVALQSNFGRYLCFDPVAGVVLADREAATTWETFTVSPWWAEGVVGTPLEGPIRASYTEGIRDATGRRNMCLWHAGDLLACFHYDRAFALDRLNELAAYGWHGVRSWTVLRGGYWEGWGRCITPDESWYWDELRSFCDALRARGLRWLVSQGDLCAHYGQSDRESFMRQLATELTGKGGLDFVFGVDAGNEAGWNGEGDVGALTKVLEAFTAILPAEVRTLTSYDEEHPNDFVIEGVLRDLHTSRGPWPQSARRVFNVGYETQPPLFTMYSEPAGEGCQEYGGDNRVGHHVSVTAVPEEWNSREPEIQLVYAAITAIAHGQMVTFGSPGVVCDEPFTNYPSFALVPRLYAMLPPDLSAWWTFHGGDGRSFSGDRILGVPADDGLDVRCDHAASGDERLCIVYGPAGSYPLPVINNFEGHELDMATLEPKPLQLTAGGTYTASFKYGRLLLGRIW